MIHIILQILYSFLSSPVWGGVGVILTVIVPTLIRSLLKANQKNKEYLFLIHNYPLLCNFDSNKDNYCKELDQYAEFINDFGSFDKAHSFKIKRLLQPIYEMFSQVLTPDENK